MIVQQGIVIGIPASKPLAVFGLEGLMKSGWVKWLFLHIVKIVDCLVRSFSGYYLVQARIELLA